MDAAKDTVSLKSATSEDFLRMLESWLRSQPEVLILIRYSRAAGNKSFEFYTSFRALQDRLRQLPAEACVTAFRNPQLPWRGIVDDEFISECIGGVPDGSEFVVVEAVATKAGRHSLFDFSAGKSHEELREELEGRRGRPVAVGNYPPWMEESPDVISAYVPSLDGAVKWGVY